MSDFTRVFATLRDNAPRLGTLTTDDIWPLLDFVPLERNVIGKAFSEANRLGIIEGTERFIKSTRPESKGRRVQVWRAVPQNGLF